jgi:hypothetical protein
METVNLDGSYSEEIKNEVWTAIEIWEFFKSLDSSKNQR